MNEIHRHFTALQRPMWSPLKELVARVDARDGSLEVRLRRLEDDIAIRNVLNRYTYCYDASDLDGVMQTFHPDCVLVNPRGTYVGADLFRRNNGHLISTRKFSFHHISNDVVSVSDDGLEAGFSSYCNCVIAVRSGALAGASGTYVCRLLQDAGLWKIREMRITLNTRQSLTPGPSAVIAPSDSPDAPPAPPAPTIAEGSRDWIGPDALA